ncbi:hypothetical protein FKM82_016862 [Ascaphus truei]
MHGGHADSQNLRSCNWGERSLIPRACLLPRTLHTALEQELIKDCVTSTLARRMPGSLSPCPKPIVFIAEPGSVSPDGNHHPAAENGSDR